MFPGVVASDSDLVAELLAAHFPTPVEGATAADGALEPALRTVLPRLEGRLLLRPARRHPRHAACATPTASAPCASDAWARPTGPRAGCWPRRPRRSTSWAPTSSASSSPARWSSSTAAASARCRPSRPSAIDPHLCIFEFVYFARPDSRLYGKEVHAARRRMGERLAAQAPVEADLVMGVPDSGVPAAEGFARAAGIPYGQGLVKNRYIGRTFIAPGQERARHGVRRKLNPLRENIAGKRIVVVDDSIVRGTTQRAVAKMLREAGARRGAPAHLLARRSCGPASTASTSPGATSSSPPAAPSTRLEAFLGVDSLAYLSLENLVAAIGAPGAGFCDGLPDRQLPGTGAGRARDGVVHPPPSGRPGPRLTCPGAPPNRPAAPPTRRSASTSPPATTPCGASGQHVASTARPRCSAPSAASAAASPSNRALRPPGPRGLHRRGGHQGPGGPRRRAFRHASASTWWPCASTTSSAWAPSRCSCSTTSSPASSTPTRWRPWWPGVADGCRQAGCALLGGEMAEHPGAMSPGEFDLAGFAVGAVERDAMLGADRVAVGDVLVGLASPGLRSNGYSLARHVLLERRRPGPRGPGLAGGPAQPGRRAAAPVGDLRPGRAGRHGRAPRSTQRPTSPAADCPGTSTGSCRPTATRRSSAAAGTRRPSSTRSNGWATSMTTRWRASSTSDSGMVLVVAPDAVDAALAALAAKGQPATVVGRGGGRDWARADAGTAVTGTEELRAHLLAHSVRTGDFVLKSGRRSSWFIDSKQTVCRPGGMLLVAEAVLGILPEEATAIGGLTMGADPVAFVTAGVAAARGRALKAFSVRKEAKDHGGGGRIAGALDPGDRVVVTEDTVTRGTSLAEAVHAVPRGRGRGGPGRGRGRPGRDGEGPAGGGGSGLPGPARCPRPGLRLRRALRARTARHTLPVAWARVRRVIGPRAGKDLSVERRPRPSPDRERASHRHPPDPGANDQDTAMADLMTTTKRRNLLGSLYGEVRELTEILATPLTPEDQTVQSMPDVSPTKWHRAHTSWFFETFLLEPSMAGYRSFHPAYAYLFNSYYEGVGARYPRPRRGVVSRPGVTEVAEYRRHVDEAMDSLLGGELSTAVSDLVELGLHHEQQHQELLLMDIKHVLSCNPLQPAYATVTVAEPSSETPVRWVEHEGGLVEVGHDGTGFAFDNEGPRHAVHVEPFALAGRPVTCGEWMAFMDDGGYGRAELWLSDGWATSQADGWESPLYWFRVVDDWWLFTLGGPQPVDPAEPVCHVSYYEADAFARWAGARLPTESEWETVAAPAAGGAVEGRFLDTSHPAPAPDGGDRVVLRRRLAVDLERLQPLSRLPAGRRRGGRVQRQVHGQPVRAARWFLRHAARPRPRHLPQLLPALGSAGPSPACAWPATAEPRRQRHPDEPDGHPLHRRPPDR